MSKYTDWNALAQLEGSVASGRMAAELIRTVPTAAGLGESARVYAALCELLANQGMIPTVHDGATDVEITAALAAASAAGTGIVYVGPGTYSINPDYNSGRSIRLASNTTLVLARGATLQAIGGSISDYAVIYGSNLDKVAVIGEGQVVGERDSHVGSTGEHGHGLRLVECRGVRLEGITVRDCWGDGIYFGSNSSGTLPCTNVYVAPSVTVDNCRRNGISAVGVRHGRISGRITNINGTAPQAGVDIEPNFAGETYDCWTEGVIVDGCLGYGVYVTGSAVGAVPVNCGHRGAVIRNCEGGAYLGRGTLAGLVDCAYVDSVNTGAGDRVVVVDANADDYTISGNRAYLTTPDAGVTPYYLVDTTAAAYFGGNAAVGTADQSVQFIVRGVNLLSLTSAENFQIGGVGCVECQLTNAAGDVFRMPAGGALIPAAATQDIGSEANPIRALYMAGALDHEGTTAGFYGTTPTTQPTAVADPAGGATVDAESRTAIGAIIDRLQALGLMGT